MSGGGLGPEAFQDSLWQGWALRKVCVCVRACVCVHVCVRMLRSVQGTLRPGTHGHFRISKGWFGAVIKTTGSGDSQTWV